MGGVLVTANNECLNILKSVVVSNNLISLIGFILRLFNIYSSEQHCSASCGTLLLLGRECRNEGYYSVRDLLGQSHLSGKASLDDSNTWCATWQTDTSTIRSSDSFGDTSISHKFSCLWLTSKISAFRLMKKPDQYVRESMVSAHIMGSRCCRLEVRAIIQVQGRNHNYSTSCVASLRCWALLATCGFILPSIFLPVSILNLTIARRLVSAHLNTASGSFAIFSHALTTSHVRCGSPHHLCKMSVVRPRPGQLPFYESPDNFISWIKTAPFTKSTIRCQILPF
jgi:hypothetical protein